MTERRAIELLTDLLAYKGRLKIITSEVNPDRPDKSTRFHPSYFILHDVVKIEVKNDRCKAYSEEGDICSGYPASLLTRLTDWKREPGALGL